MLTPSDATAPAPAPEKKKKKKKKKKVKDAAAAAEGGEAYTGDAAAAGDGGDDEISVVFEGGNVSDARLVTPPFLRPRSFLIPVQFYLVYFLFRNLQHHDHSTPPHLPPHFLSFLSLTIFFVLFSATASCRAQGRIGQRCLGGLQICMGLKQGPLQHAHQSTTTSHNIYLSMGKALYNY